MFAPLIKNYEMKQNQCFEFTTFCGTFRHHGHKTYLEKYYIRYTETESPLNLHYVCTNVELEQGGGASTPGL